MTISESRKARLDRAMEDILAINPVYKACPNPDCIEISFELPDVPKDCFIMGISFFDLRKAYTQSLAKRGFLMKVDNQGSVPINILVCDILPEECEDGEILQIDVNGCLIQWNADDQEIYNCGETPEEFGLDNIRSHEMERIVAGMPMIEISKTLMRAKEAVYANHHRT